MRYNYFKQALASIRQQPVVSVVSIIGTALAILLIMVIVMMDEVKVSSFSPESNRDRWLVYKYGSISHDTWGTEDSSNGPLGFNTVKQVFYPLETPEAVTAFVVHPSEAAFSLPGEGSFGADLRDVDDRFWNVMDFTFIAGKPFTRADFESGIPVVVISEELARKLYKSVDVVGRQLLINHVPYNVCGVVEDVSELADKAYAKAWVPFTTTNVGDFSWCSYMGGLSVIILAENSGDFGKIRDELTENFSKFGDEIKLSGWSFIQRGRPYTQYVAANTPWANLNPDMESVERGKLIVFSILLIVPAINLSNMTHSRLRRRREEIGVRRAFGAKRSAIITDIFIENLIISLIAGVLGLGLSVIFALIWKEGLFGSGRVNLEILIHWSTFGWALLFCFLLNLLSAGMPVWKASRVNVVNALNNKVK